MGALSLTSYSDNSQAHINALKLTRELIPLFSKIDPKKWGKSLTLLFNGYSVSYKEITSIADSSQFIKIHVECQREYHDVYLEASWKLWHSRNVCHEGTATRALSTSFNPIPGMCDANLHHPLHFHLYCQGEKMYTLKTF